jgi:ATP-dependent DNA ligase
MVKLSPAMTTALPRSISFVTTANDSVFLYAFDLIELNGDDLRRDPLQVRKATLVSILAKARPGIRFNEHIEGDDPNNKDADGIRAGARNGQIVLATSCLRSLDHLVGARQE